MTAAADRWCPSGQHWQPPERFRHLSWGRTARDCRACEKAAIERPHAKPAPVCMDGVDIDRIHYLRGAVRKRAP